MTRIEQNDVFLPESRTAFYEVSPVDRDDVMLAKRWQSHWSLTKYVDFVTVTAEHPFKAVTFEEPLDQTRIPEYCIFRSAVQNLGRFGLKYRYDELKVKHDDLYKGKIQVVQFDADEVEIARWPAGSGYRLHLFEKNPA